MSPERRIYARRILYSPEYLDMGADNGGVVVNLSEGGLGFQAVGRVAPDSQIALSFSLGPGYRIDVKARVVWVSSQGKLGGAVFGKLSKDSRSLIHEWLSKSESEYEVGTVRSAPGAESEKEELLPGGFPPVNAAGAPAIPPEPPKPDLADGAFAPHPVLEPVAEIAARNEVVRPLHDARTPLEQSTAAGMARFASPSSDAAAPPSMPPESAPDHARAIPKPPGAVRFEAMRGKTPPAPVLKPQDVPAAPIGQRSSAPAGKPDRGSASFSLVPSISAWSGGKDALAGSSAGAPPKTTAPLFPPRDAENIFARSRGAVSSLEPAQRRGSSVLLIIAILIAAGAVLAFYVRTHRQQVGSAIVRIGNGLAGEPATASTTAPVPARPVSSNPQGTPSTGGGTATAPTAAPPAIAAQTPAIAPTSGEPAKANLSPALPPGTPAKPPSANPAQPNTGRKISGTPVPAPSPTSQSPQPAAPLGGQAEYQRAEGYLNGKGVAQDPVEAAEWFWRSLEAGNTGAAIPLADLYLQGKGVSRSCTQARILLDAAARKNNPVAIEKLGQLPENCD